LVRVEPAASAVRELFRRRALGASYADLARFLEAEGVFPPTGNPHWSNNGITNLLQNRVYLGEARAGILVNTTAHEPIVSQAEFDAAQGQRTLLATPTESLSAEAMLVGIARCAGCGHTLKISGSFDKQLARRVPNYYCIGRYAKGICPARASIRADKLDPYVQERVLAALRDEGGVLAQAVEASEQIEQAARAVAEAEHELELYLTSELLTVIGQERFLQGVDVRQQTLDNARAELAGLREQGVLAEELTSGDVVSAWPELVTQERRQFLHGLLDRVLVKRSDGRRAGTLPVAERTQIVLRGNVLLDEPAAAEES
jgi:hypothetical protein